jgi:hypothetical protein
MHVGVDPCVQPDCCAIDRNFIAGVLHKSLVEHGLPECS